MTKLELYAVTTKKFRPHSNRKVAKVLENVLRRYFTTTSIHEK